MSESTDFHPMMKCGHAANATTTRNDETVPCCVICAGITAGYDVIDDAPSDLTGRVSRCTYYRRGFKCPDASCMKDHCPPTRHEHHGGNYPSIAPSSPNLPFFSHKPDKDFDEHFCGCWGWD